MGQAIVHGHTLQALARQMAPVLRPWASMLGLMTLCAALRSLLVGEGRAELPALLIWCIGYGPLALVSSYQSLHHVIEPVLLGCMLGRAVAMVGCPAEPRGSLVLVSHLTSCGAPHGRRWQWAGAWWHCRLQ